MLRAAPILTLWGGLRQGRFTLWDEDLGRMVPFKSAGRHGSQAQQVPKDAQPSRIIFNR
jgi:hypothetical protein